MTLILDSSALIAALVDSGIDGVWAATVIQREQVLAPELLMAETANALRRFELEGRISPPVAHDAYDRLLSMSIELHPFAPYSERIWELRFNLTPYDAWYVAMAEAMDCPLATLDLRMARASGTSYEFLLPRAIA